MQTLLWIIYCLWHMCLEDSELNRNQILSTDILNIFTTVKLFCYLWSQHQISMWLFWQLLLAHLKQQMTIEVNTWQEGNIHTMAEADFRPLLVDNWLLVEMSYSPITLKADIFVWIFIKVHYKMKWYACVIFIKWFHTINQFLHC